MELEAFIADGLGTVEDFHTLDRDGNGKIALPDYSAWRKAHPKKRNEGGMCGGGDNEKAAGVDPKATPETTWRRITGEDESVYFINIADESTSWDPPPGSGDGSALAEFNEEELASVREAATSWRKVTDGATGETYYSNLETRETAWDYNESWGVPEIQIPEFEVSVDEDSSHDEATKEKDAANELESTAAQTAGASPWRRVSGNSPDETYYVNLDTDLTVWRYSREWGVAESDILEFDEEETDDEVSAASEEVDVDNELSS
jgi:hypothetical protein